MNNADAWCIDKPSARVIANRLADLRLASKLGKLENIVLEAASTLNCLLHTAARPIGKRWSPERPPRVGDRWTCSSNETRMGRAWVVARVDRFISSKGTRDTPTTIIIFRDPDDAEHTCHIGASQLKRGGWAPVPEETLRLTAEVLYFMRTGPADLTGRLERTCRRHEWSPAVECCPGWQGWVEIFQTLMPPQAHVVRCHVCRKYPDDASLAAAVGDEGRRVVHPTALWSRGEPEDCFYGFVKPEQRDAYERGEPGPFPRLLRPEAAALPQIGEVWVGPAGRVWRITGRHGPDIVAETRHDGRMSKAILLSRLLTEWRRATPEEIERVCDARDWIVVDKTPGPR